MKSFFLNDIVDEWKPRSLVLRGDGDGDGGGWDASGGGMGNTGGGDWGSFYGTNDFSGMNADAFGSFDVGQSLAFDAMMGGMPGVTTGPGEWGGWGSWATQDAAGNWGVNDITGNFAGMNAPGVISPVVNAPPYTAEVNSPDITGQFGANYGTTFTAAPSYDISGPSYASNLSDDYGPSYGSNLSDDYSTNISDISDIGRGTIADNLSDYQSDPGLDEENQNIAENFQTQDEIDPEDYVSHASFQTDRALTDEDQPAPEDEYTPSAQQSRDVQDIISRGAEPVARDEVPESREAPTRGPQEENLGRDYRGPTQPDDPMYTNDPYVDIDKAQRSEEDIPPALDEAMRGQSPYVMGGPQDYPVADPSGDRGPAAPTGGPTGGPSAGNYPGGGGYPSGGGYPGSTTPSGAQQFTAPSLSLGPDPSGYYPGFAGNAAEYQGPFAGPDVVGNRGNVSLPSFFTDTGQRGIESFEAPSRGPSQALSPGNIPSRGGPSTQGLISGLRGPAIQLGPSGQRGGSTLADLLSGLGNLLGPSQAQAATPSFPGGPARGDYGPPTSPTTPDIPVPFVALPKSGRSGRAGRNIATRSMGRSIREAGRNFGRNNTANPPSSLPQTNIPRSAPQNTQGLQGEEYQSAVAQNLAASRANMIADLARSPELRSHFDRLATNEVGYQGRDAIQKFMEMVMNRAAADAAAQGRQATGRDLWNWLNNVSEFPDSLGKMARGSPGGAVNNNADLLDKAANGSNEANYATTNASSGRFSAGPYGGGPQTATSNPGTRGAEGYGIQGSRGPSMSWAQSMGYQGPTQGQGRGYYNVATSVAVPNQSRGYVTAYGGPLAGPDVMAQGRAGAPPALAAGPPAVAPPTQALPSVSSLPPMTPMELTGPGMTSFQGAPTGYQGREGTQADYGANYGPGPAAVVGPYNMDIDPSGLSGQTGRAGYPSTEFDPGGLQGQTGRAGFPSTVTDPGGLQGQIGRAGYPSAATDPGGLQGQAGRAGYPSTVTDLGGLFGQTGRAGYPSTETDPGGLQGQQGRAGYPNAVETPAISALPAQTQQDLSNVIEVLETKGATPAQVGQIIAEMLRDAGAPQQVAQEIAKEAADISAFTGPGHTTQQGAEFAPVTGPGFTTFTGEPVAGPGFTTFTGQPGRDAFPTWLTDLAGVTQGPGNPLAGLAPATTPGIPGGWQAQVNQAYGPFDFSTPAGPYAGPFAGPDVVGARGVPTEAPIGARSDWAATKGDDKGLAPSLQAMQNVTPNFKGVFNDIINNVPEAQRGDFGKAINNLSDRAKTDLLNRGPEALIAGISKSTGRSVEMITGWFNGQFAGLGYPGYPGGMQGLGRDMQAARDQAVAQAIPGRASTQFQDPSIVADVRGPTSPGWVDQTQVGAEPPSIAPPTQEMPTTPESLPPMEPLSSPMPHATGPGGITEIAETPSSVAPPSVPAAPPDATVPSAAVPDAREAARADPQTAQQIISTNPQAVTNIANSYGVDMATAAMLLVFLWMGAGEERKKLSWEMAEGGRVYYVPQGSRGDDFGRWPKAPTPDYPGMVAGYGREIARRHYDAQQGARAIAETIKINSRNWERFLRESPRSTNIEDRREKDETMGAGYQQGGGIPWGQDWGKEDDSGWR